MTEKGDIEISDPLGIGSDTWQALGMPQQDFPAALYVVAMPLGNAADVTLRALWILAHVDAIACEDTRTSSPLLSRYGLDRRRLLALHLHNEAHASSHIVEQIARGERVALITDAGTPAISDPGAILVRQVRAAGLRVIPVPGPSSLTAALSAAGTEGDVLFAGFAPSQGAARKRHWQRMVRVRHATVVFEAPHRIADLVKEWQTFFAPEQEVVVARELTKKFETIAQCTVSTLGETLAQMGSRGEFVLILLAQAAQPDDVSLAPEKLDETTSAWLLALQAELPASRLAALAARVTGLPRATLYQHLLQNKIEGGSENEKH